MIKQQTNYEGQLNRIVKLREQLVINKEKEHQALIKNYINSKDYILSLQKKEEKRMCDMINYVFNFYDKSIEKSTTMRNFKRGRKLVSINNNNSNYNNKQLIQEVKD